jgi:MFS family permease
MPTTSNYFSPKHIFALPKTQNDLSCPSPWGAFAHRNFRLYIFGQGVSIIGSWMQQVAMAWLVYQLTAGSPQWLGLVCFAGQIPALFLTPLAGCLIDSHDRRRLLYLTQSVAMLQAVVLAVLTLTGYVEPWHVVALSLVLGTANAFDIPTRQSFLSELVDKRTEPDTANGRRPDLANAIAINSSVFNGARVIGPTCAGFLLWLTSPGVCFLANAFTYLAVLGALWAMRLPPRKYPPAQGHVLSGLREGLAYAWRSKPIRSLLVLIGLFNMAGMAESTLLPIISTSLDPAANASSATVQPPGTASGGAFAFLSAAAGLGAFLAALFLVSRRGIGDLGKWIALTPAAYGLAMLTFSFAASLWTAALLLIVTGFSLLLMTAGANTILQTIVAEDKRGRVVSFYTTMVTGLSPLGGLLAGQVADSIGAPLTLRFVGGCCLLAAILQSARSSIVDKS